MPAWFHLQRSGPTQLLVYAALGVLAVAVVALPLLGQFSLLIAISFLCLFLITYLLAPTACIFIVLAFSTTTGFWDRLLSYLAGQDAPIDFVRASIEIFILIIGLQALLRRKRAINNQATRRMDFLVGAYLFLATLQTLNIFFSSPVVTIWGWRWECIPLLLYYAGRQVGTSTKNVNRYYRMLIILTIVLAAYAVYQGAVGLPGFERAWLAKLPLADQQEMVMEGSFFTAGKVRIPSMTVGHSYYTFLASYLLIWVLFTPRVSLTPTFRILRYVGIIMTGLYLLYSLERSAVGSIAIGIGVVIWLSLKRKTGYIALILLGLMVIGMFFVNTRLHTSTNPSVIERRLLELTNPFKAATVDWRIARVWPQSIAALAKNPLGYGLGTFQQTSVNISRLPFGPHNNYFRIALETGILGVGIFILIWGVYILLLLKAYQLNISRSLAVCSLASLVPILAVAVFNNPFENPLTLFIWFSTGLTISQIAATIKQEYG
jgi:O-antigen ligase